MEFDIKKPQASSKGDKLLKVAFITALAVALVHIASAMTIDKIIQYKEVPLVSPDVPSHIDGYRIGFITDIHALPSDTMNAMVDKLNTKGLDLLLLGGDFPTKGKAPERALEILSQVEAKDGIYGVDGNHDNYRTLFRAMEKFSIIPLTNSGLYVREGFFLAGVEDLILRKPDIAKAIEGSKEDDFVILLSHNPDVTMLQSTKGVDLALCGHTHSGQVTLFGIWAPYLSFTKGVTKYGQRFMKGWAKSMDGVPVYVSNGTGDYLPRVFARRQVIIVTLCQE
ncbi:MAG: metallophosphoesterase [Eubacteriaceae bacterium]|nr:metallophosphoesterase [Eubacteriaceae bacterium]